MTTAATGRTGKALEAVRAALSECAAYQALGPWVDHAAHDGEPAVDASALALATIHIEATDVRPTGNVFAVVMVTKATNEQVTNGGWVQSRTFDIRITTALRAISSSVTVEDQAMDLINKSDDIIEDLQDQSQSGVMFSDVDLSDGPYVLDGAMEEFFGQPCGGFTIQVTF